MTPACSAAATISRPSATEKHIGFSVNTCSPARAAATAIGAWLPEVSTRTASSGCRSISRQSVNTAGMRYRSAHARALSPAMSHTAAISNRSASSVR